MEQVTEVWLRGQTIMGISPLLQPVAHALMQAKGEIDFLMNDFPDGLLWIKPANCASAGFHLLHINGVLDRLLTYAEGESLTPEQLQYLNREKQILETTTEDLVSACHLQIAVTLKRLQQFKDNLLEYRSVGRAALPSTVLGLCVHAAEHTMRHVGQLLVTVKVVKQSNRDV